MQQIIMNYSHHAVQYTSRSYLFYNWKPIPFNQLHPFLPTATYCLWQLLMWFLHIGVLLFLWNLNLTRHPAFYPAIPGGYLSPKQVKRCGHLWRRWGGCPEVMEGSMGELRMDSHNPKISSWFVGIILSYLWFCLKWSFTAYQSEASFNLIW